VLNKKASRKFLYNVKRTETFGFRNKRRRQIRQQVLKTVTRRDDTTRGCVHKRHTVCSRAQLWSNNVATCLQYSSYYHCRGIPALS